MAGTLFEQLCVRWWSQSLSAISTSTSTNSPCFAVPSAPPAALGRLGPCLLVLGDAAGSCISPVDRATGWSLGHLASDELEPLSVGPALFLSPH